MFQSQKKQQGVILIISALVLLILLILGSYFLTFILTESKISRAELVAAQSYYLAEAGLNEAIWRLINDPDWQAGFITPPLCENWSANLSRDNLLLPDSSYQIQIQNQQCGQAELIATSTIKFGKEKSSQRVIKIKAYRALGSLTENSPFFTGGTSENMDISASVLNVYQGNIFSNNNINIKDFSSVKIFDNPETDLKEGKALVHNNLNLSWSSQLAAEAICSKNYCRGDCADQGCPPTNVSMPMIDFDSAAASSYKNRAIALEQNNLCSILCNGIVCSQKCVLTEGEFEDLLWRVGLNGTLTLNSGITYVTGRIELRGGRQLVINGVLVADETVDIGERWCWVQRGRIDCGFNQITINDPGINQPSGLLTKRNLTFGPYSSFQKIEITGLVYSNDEINMLSCPSEFKLVGGLLGRKISISSLWANLNIYLDNQRILEGIWAGSKPPDQEKPPYSPLITIEHWEEIY